MILCQLKAVNIVLKGMQSQLKKKKKQTKPQVASHMEWKVDQCSQIQKTKGK